MLKAHRFLYASFSIFFSIQAILAAKAQEQAEQEDSDEETSDSEGGPDDEAGTQEE